MMCVTGTRIPMGKLKRTRHILLYQHQPDPFIFTPLCFFQTLLFKKHISYGFFVMCRFRIRRLFFGDFYCDCLRRNRIVS